MDAPELRQRTEKFSHDITKFCDSLPQDQVTRKISGQLHDAASSMSQNYRAACRGRSHDEFTSKLCITVEESDEVVGWLNSLEASGRGSGPELTRLAKEALELLKIFAASKRTALRNKRKRKGQKRPQE